MEIHEYSVNIAPGISGGIKNGKIRIEVKDHMPTHQKDGFRQIHPFSYGGILYPGHILVLANMEGSPIKPTTVEEYGGKRAYFIGKDIITVRVSNNVRMKTEPQTWDIGIQWLHAENSQIQVETLFTKETVDQLPPNIGNEDFLRALTAACTFVQSYG